MKRNFVKEKLKRGESSVGTWLTLADPISARLMARVGFDWLTVEMEHTPVTLDAAAQSFAAIAAEGTTPLVRVPWNTGENFKRVLDLGAWGVVAPMVNSADEARACVRWARYFPEGERSVGGQLHALGFDTDPATYYARANEAILVAVMAEHVRAVENADEILSVPGVDVVFIGPNDLHNSMGKKPVFDSDDEEYVSAVRHVLELAKKHGVAPGIHVIDVDSAKRRLAEGFQFVAIASEAGMMLTQAGQIARALGIGGDRKIIRY